MKVPFSNNIQDNTKMYAIFWTSSNGQTGNGEYILDEESLYAWLDKLRTKYPDMKHWGQLANGEVSTY